MPPRWAHTTKFAIPLPRARPAGQEQVHSAASTASTARTTAGNETRSACASGVPAAPPPAQSLPYSHIHFRLYVSGSDLYELSTDCSMQCLQSTNS